MSGCECTAYSSSHTLLLKKEGQRAGPRWHEDAVGSKNLIITVGAHATGRGDSFTLGVCAVYSVRVCVYSCTCARVGVPVLCTNAFAQMPALYVCVRARERGSVCVCIHAIHMTHTNTHQGASGRSSHVVGAASALSSMSKAALHFPNANQISTPLPKTASGLIVVNSGADDNQSRDTAARARTQCFR